MSEVRYTGSTSVRLGTFGSILALTTEIPIARPWLPPFAEFADLANDIFDRRYVSNFSKYCKLLEEKASAVLDSDVLSVSSCDIGMTLAWRAFELGGGEVIVPSFTFASTVNAILWNGLTPIFADIEPSTLCLDPGSVKTLTSEATVGIAATHCFGEPVSEEIDQIALKHSLVLVFDAAHAIGTKAGTRSLAGRGDASVFSLSGTKLVTAGEGGLAAFRDPTMRRRFEELRGYGFIEDYDVKRIGLNGKMSELNAALGYLSLAHLDELVARRSEIAARYRRNLIGRHNLEFQPEPPPGDTRSYKDFVIIFPDAETRAAVELALMNREIETKRYFLPAHTMTAFRNIPQRSLLEVTMDIRGRTLCVPIYFDLTDAQVDYVSAEIDEAICLL